MHTHIPPLYCAENEHRLPPYIIYIKCTQNVHTYQIYIIRVPYIYTVILFTSIISIHANGSKIVFGMCGNMAYQKGGLSSITLIYIAT